MASTLLITLKATLARADVGLIVALCAGLLFICTACLAIYRIFFHPLAAYPGPLLAKVTRLYALSISLNRTRSFAQYELLKKYGSPLRITPNGLLFADVKAWTDIYGQSGNPCLKASFFYDSFTVTGATNLLNAVDKSQHARVRRLVSHSFSLHGVLESEALLRSKVEAYVDNVFRAGVSTKSSPNTPPGSSNTRSVEIYTKTHQHYFDIIAQLSFGRPFSSLTDETATSYRDVDHFIDVVPITSLFPFLRRLPLRFIRDGYRGVDRLEGFSRQAIRDFISDLDGQKSEKDNEGGQFLRNLVTAKDAETGSNLTVDELVENVIIFLVAGSGTTAVTTTYFIWEMGRRPEMQKKLVEEIRATFPDPDIFPSYERASKLPYLNATIEETLRLWAPLNVEIPRVSPGRVLGDGGQFIPAGTVVSISSYATARDPHVFPQPDAFVPDRWTHPTSEMKAMSRPFSTGPRNCVGKHLAQVNLTLTLTRIFQLFDLVVDPTMTDEMMKPLDRGALEPRGGKLLVKVTRAEL